jgi:hypothetical protein
MPETNNSDGYRISELGVGKDKLTVENDGTRTKPDALGTYKILQYLG